MLKTRRHQKKKKNCLLLGLQSAALMTIHHVLCTKIIIPSRMRNAIRTRLNASHSHGRKTSHRNDFGDGRVGGFAYFLQIYHAMWDSEPVVAVPTLTPIFDAVRERDRTTSARHLSAKRRAKKKKFEDKPDLLISERRKGQDKVSTHTYTRTHTADMKRKD